MAKELRPMTETSYSPETWTLPPTVVAEVKMTWSPDAAPWVLIETTRRVESAEVLKRLATEPLTVRAGVTS
jgi:hypothetical protein